MTIYMLKSVDTYLWPLHLWCTRCSMENDASKSHITYGGDTRHDVGFHFLTFNWVAVILQHTIFPIPHTLRHSDGGMTIELQLSGQVQLTQTITKSPKSEPKSHRSRRQSCSHHNCCPRKRFSLNLVSFWYSKMEYTY